MTCHHLIQTALEDSACIPNTAGIGLRGPHMAALQHDRPDIDWLEVHAENYFAAGGIPNQHLLRIRRNYPLSIHGVGLSLGSSDPLNVRHLARLKCLIEQLEPGLVSEHLSWSSVDGVYFNDLLPLPYTEEALVHFCTRVEQVQDYLARPILIENPSSYLSYRHSTIPEGEFLAEVARRSGAGLLLDVNNLYVSSYNLGFDPLVYLQSIPAERVMEFHLAGHTKKVFPDGSVLIDDHASPVSNGVWHLYRQTVQHLGARPTLIEWDQELPALDVLLHQAQLAQTFLEYDHERLA